MAITTLPKPASNSESLKASLLALEPRIMLDGAAVVTGADVLTEPVDPQQTEAAPDASTTDHESTSTQHSQDSLVASLATLDSPSDRREIVFIDTSVEDYQTLMSGIDPNAEVVLLDSTRDGIKQIADILQGRTGFDAIHVVSHGSQGELQLGTATLTLESMNGEYADELGVVGQALNDSADWLIYGCNFGEGETGQAAATRLAKLTGADVAASSDLTGSATLGGDWDLEVTTGEIETTVVVSTQAQLLFTGILADGDTTTSFQEGSDSYASTQDTYIDESSPSSSFGSNTTATVDADTGSGNDAQALIRFDNIMGTGSGQVPSGATIISARLELNVSDASASGATIGLHRMLTTWTESSTWNSLTNGVQTDGSDASATADATVADPTATGTIILDGLESTVQAWADGSATNYGWVLTNDNADGWSFNSSENGTTSLRPKLIVEYSTSGGDTTTGLTGQWDFDADANDSSGNSYNGTLTNGASIDTTDITDKVGAGKLSLDGSNDYVDLSSHVSNFSGLTEGTIAGWVNLTTTGTHTILDSSDLTDTNSYINLAINNGSLEFDIRENGTTLLFVTTDAKVHDGAWHHVAVTVDTSGNSFYIDGNKIADADLTYSTGSSATSMFFDDVNDLDSMNIGRNEDSGGGNWYFDGLLDEVRVYNRALTVADIAALAAEAPVAANDSATTTKDTAVNINLTSNDSDLDSETITILDVGNPTNGTVVNNEDGTVTYTPTTSYIGTDSFTYLTADLDDTVSYWRLDGSGTDAVASNDGTLTGTTTVAGVYGNALSFDEVDDKVQISDFDINNDFSFSFKFKIDDHTGTEYQYLYSHGTNGTQNSFNIFLGEASNAVTADRGVLNVRFHDSNDNTGDGALDADINHLIGDGQWHTFTMTVAAGEGTKVFVDGILQDSDSRGGDSFNPTTDLYLGAREDLDADRFFGGSLDSVQLFNRALSAEEVSDVHTGGSSLGTVNVLVNDPPVNSVPGAQVVNKDTTLTFNTLNGNLISISDGDAGSDPLRVTLTATNGTMTLSQTTGLTFTTGDGTSDATMVFEGTLANINAALDGLTFLGTSDYNGSANIQLTTDDLTMTSLNEDTDLVGYYTFDNTGDLGNDDSTAGSNDGTVNGAVTNSDATRGNVLELDGVNDNIQITGLMGSPADVTLAAWVNFDSGASEGEVISIGDYVAIRVDESGGRGVQAFFYDGSSWHVIDSGTYIAGTGWHHVAYVFDDTANTQTLYIDGIAVMTGSRTESISYSGEGSNTFIGQNGNASNRYFDGKIDDARIFDRALTVTEIQNLAFEPVSIDTDNISITINAANDEPTISNLSGDALGYSEGDGAIVIDQSTAAAVSDVDSADFDTGTLTVSFISGSDAAEDVLSIRDQGVGASNITVSGSTVSYGGTQIGTFTGGSSGTDLVITLDTNADPTGITALVQNITYENTDTSSATLGARTVRFVLTDGDGGTSANYDTTVTVSDSNADPVITSNGGGASTSVSVAEGATAVTTVTATDADLDTLTYSILGGADAGRFSINSSSGALAFSAAPDFESPLDANTDNVYEVQVQVSDGNGGTDTQTINVTVTNVVEAPPPPPPPDPEPDPPPEEPPAEENTIEAEQDLNSEAATVFGPPAENGSRRTEEQERSSDSKERQFQTIGANSSGSGSESQFQDEVLSPLALQAIQGNLPTGLNFFEFQHSTPSGDQYFPFALELDQLSDQLKAAPSPTLELVESVLPRVATGTGITFSAGYLLWLLRSGSFFTTMLTAVNSVRNFDPLPVLTGAGSVEDAAAELAAESQEFKGIDNILDKTPPSS